MPIKYAQFTVSIHGIDAEEDALDFLKGWIMAETKAGLLGNQRDRFRFRDMFESDIEVELIETVYRER